MTIFGKPLRRRIQLMEKRGSFTNSFQRIGLGGLTRSGDAPKTNPPGVSGALPFFAVDIG